MHDYSARFKELIERGHQVPVHKTQINRFVDNKAFHAWAASALNILEMVYGIDATYTKRLRDTIDSDSHRVIALEDAIGIFTSAAEEFELGFLKRVRREVADEFVIDTCLLAESLLADGYSQSAAVLAAAALEDCFKRRAEDNGITTDDKTLADHINALKGAGVLSGATAKIVSGFPKFRNSALHADWGKISDADTSSICAFLKTYIIT